MCVGVGKVMHQFIGTRVFSYLQVCAARCTVRPGDADMGHTHPCVARGTEHGPGRGCGMDEGGVD